LASSVANIAKCKWGLSIEGTYIAIYSVESMVGVGEGAFKSWWLWRFKTLNGAGSPELLVDRLIGAVLKVVWSKFTTLS